MVNGSVLSLYFIFPYLTLVHGMPNKIISDIMTKTLLNDICVAKCKMEKEIDLSLQIKF